jgi:hypothetical protein
MMRFWQVTAAFFLSFCPLSADEAAHQFTWNSPRVVTSIFSQDFGMLDSERDDYATNLATHAANAITAAKASPASLADAQRMLSLALQLSPRNKRAVVVNFQLSKGMLPEISESNYSPQVFARLILTRGLLLNQQGGEENRQAARFFIQLAADLDPKNEDAVYASEVQRLDHGAADWKTITQPEADKP